MILATVGFWETSEAVQASSQVTIPANSAGEALSYADAVDKASPAVVSVHTTKEIQMESHPLLRDPFFRQFFGNQFQQGMPTPKEQPGLGSGVIVDSKGYILTNNHVIKDANEITVKLTDGRSAKAKVIGVDPESDLAVLKISIDKLPVISIGSAKNKRVGDVVLAIGNPFGVGQTVTQGIISALQRNELGINMFENFIQTDASINPGNSGGALIDAQGNLIGINTAIYTNSGGNLGIGFAIPIDSANEVLTQLISKGHVTRGFMGISVRALTEELRKELAYPKGDGVVVAAIVYGGPAHKAGIQPGDIITKIDGKNTPDQTTLLSVTSNLQPEKPYRVVIARDGQTLEFRVTVTQRPVEKEKKVLSDDE